MKKRGKAKAIAQSMYRLSSLFKASCVHSSSTYLAEYTARPLKNAFTSTSIQHTEEQWHKNRVVQGSRSVTYI